MMNIKRYESKIVVLELIIIIMLIFGSAAVCSGVEYAFKPEEIMYLAGIEMASYKEGARYTLYDIDKDDISELFIIDDAENPGRLKIFRFDPEKNEAVMIKTIDGVTAVYGDDLENSIKTAAGDVYKEYAVINDMLEEKSFSKDNDDDARDYSQTDMTDLKPLLWIGNDQWVDGSIIGVASRIADPGLNNDFYLSSNYEWLSDVHSKSAEEISDLSSDLEKIVSENKKMMFTDREKYQGEDIRIIRDFYDTAANWERREAEGIEPVKKYLDAAANVSSISELTDFLTDPELDPFCYLLSITITLDEKDTSHWAAEIAEDNFSVLPRVYHNETREDIEAVRADFDLKARHVLLRAGYTEKEVEKVMGECYELEEILLPLSWPDEADEASPLNGFLPVDTVTLYCKNFPLKQLLNAYQIRDGKVHVYFPGYLKKLDQLYTEENLSMFRSYIIAHIAAVSCDYLDLEAVSCLNSETISEEEIKENLNSGYQSEVLSRQGLMNVAVENAYMTYFADPETRTDLIELAQEIRDTFRERLSRENWLSDAGKTAAIEKLDNMTFSVMFPDVLIDSSYLAADKDKSFLDNYAKITVNRMKHNGAFAGTLREKGDWRYDLQPGIGSTVSNAFYYGCYNQFFILSGFVSDSIYRQDMAIEEKLALLGEIIGHELTHGFDPNGIKYDKDGNMVVTDEKPHGWMPEEDYLSFMDRAEKIADYFDQIRPFPYESCPGKSQWGEAAADIGGLMIGLDIAAKTEDFDYDRFFRTYSELWRKQSTLEWERSDIYDAHPLNHLRINVTVQQFDEFLDTYDVREGDGMYLDPKDRISIW